MREGRAKDRTDVLAVIRARHAAVHDGRCEDAVSASSSDVVCYDLQPPLQFAGAEARDPADLRDWLATWSGPVSLTLPDPTITIDGDLALVCGLSRMQGDKKGDGPIELWYRSTIALRRDDDGWRIFHEHNSVPMKMDGSGLADVGLRP